VHALDAYKRKIALVPMKTAVRRDPVQRRPVVAVQAQRGADPPEAPALVARTGRARFEIGRRAAGKPTTEHQGPPPVTFRERDTGLVRVVYREIVVRFRAGVSERTRAALFAEDGLVVRRKNSFVRDQVVVYHPERKYSGEELLAIANRFAESDDVVFAAPNFVSQFRRSAMPRIRSEQWHLHNRGGGGAVAGEDIGIRAAWRITRGSPRIVVAVLDDGVDVEHPNLRGRIWRNPDKQSPDRIGRDFFVPPDSDHYDPRPKRFRYPYDDMDMNDIHGTACAGLIAAEARDGGAPGVAPRCRILPVKVFHADELAPDEAVADAIRYAARHAAILSCSWTGGSSPDVQMALEDAGRARGGLGAAIFCAAGNEGGDPVGFPARDEDAIGIGASTDQARRASYSNIGRPLDLVAPSSGGVRDIFTTDVSLPRRGFNLGAASKGGKDGRFCNDFGGTSAATPIAAGVAALVLSVHSRLSRVALRTLLIETADKIGKTKYNSKGHNREFGHGRIHAGRAVELAAELAP
jgi:subtilisin family serine protease